MNIRSLPDYWREFRFTGPNHIGPLRASGHIDGLHDADNGLEAVLPKPTIITEDESTQPEDGQEFVYRDDLGGGKWSELEGAEWAARDMHNDYISDVWIGCIWWPVGDLFDVPADTP